MKLSRLWIQHQQFEAQGLKDNFGDGYLVHHNKIYSNIRKKSLKNGFLFSSAENSLYQALPLSQLEWILSKKIIPYYNNVSALAEVNNKLPENILWDDISDNLKGNHVFHESCHSVARSLTSEIIPKNPAKNKFDLQKWTLIRLLEESFANSCELLAVTDASDVIHRIFFELNSYVVMFEDRTHLKKSLHDLGAENLTKWMILSYLQANFLRPSINDQTFEKMLLFLKPHQSSFSTADKKTLRAFSKIAFQLNLRFRQVTTSFYFKLSGVTLPLNELLDFDFLETLKNSQELCQSLDLLAKIIHSEI